MSYTPTEWDNGDVITAAKLNKIEQGISEVSNSGGSGGNANILIVHATADTSIPESEPTVILDKTYTEIDAAISAGTLVCVDVVEEAMLQFVQKIPGSGDIPSALLFSSALTTNGTSIVCSTLEVTANDTIRLLQYFSDLG